MQRSPESMPEQMPTPERTPEEIVKEEIRKEEKGDDAIIGQLKEERLEKGLVNPKKHDTLGEELGQEIKDLGGEIWKKEAQRNGLKEGFAKFCEKKGVGLDPAFLDFEECRWGINNPDFQEAGRILTAKRDLGTKSGERKAAGKTLLQLSETEREAVSLNRDIKDSTLQCSARVQITLESTRKEFEAAQGKNPEEARRLERELINLGSVKSGMDDRLRRINEKTVEARLRQEEQSKRVE